MAFRSNEQGDDLENNSKLVSEEESDDDPF